MKIKKRIIPVLAAVLVSMNAVASTALAHPYDYWNGKYIGKSDAKLLFRITQSAQTDLLNWVDVYSAGYGWSNISDNVEIGLVYATSGMPSFSGEMVVFGKEYTDGTLGETFIYGSSGELEPTNNNLNSNWDHVAIAMNTDSNIFNLASDPIAAARKTFVHEIGHALKLCHPVQAPNTDRHNIDDLPKAIMNPGFPNSQGGATSATITAHDKTCLRAKWGY